MNHASFNNPTTGLNSSNFGRILTAGEPRIMQFALKYDFFRAMLTTMLAVTLRARRAGGAEAMTGRRTTATPAASASRRSSRSPRPTWRSWTTAWTFDTEAGPLQVTPLVIDGIVVRHRRSNVFALEPETGKAASGGTRAPAAVSRRGVAYWPGDGTTSSRASFAGAGDRHARDRREDAESRPRDSATRDRST